MKKIFAIVAVLIAFGCGTASKENSTKKALAETSSSLVSIAFSSWGKSSPKLVIDVPNDWEYHINKGPDFNVHQFKDIGGCGEIGIYIGHHPSFGPSDSEKTGEGYFGDHRTTFYRNSDDEIVLTQALITDYFSEYLLDSGIGGEEFVRAFESGDSEVAKKIIHGEMIGTLKIHVMIWERKQGFTDMALDSLRTVKKK